MHSRGTERTWCPAGLAVAKDEMSPGFNQQVFVIYLYRERLRLEHTYVIPMLTVGCAMHWATFAAYLKYASSQPKITHVNINGVAELAADTRGYSDGCFVQEGGMGAGGQWSIYPHHCPSPPRLPLAFFLFLA